MESNYPTIQLDSDRLPAGPWIYGRQVLRPELSPPDGSLVEVSDASGRFVGHALFNAASDIRLRVLSRGKRSDLRQPREFLLRRLGAARRLREKALRLDQVSDTYRLVHAEGDDLPGLIVDRLGEWLVCEHHSLGFWKLRQQVEWALGQLYPNARVMHRMPRSAARSEGCAPLEQDPGEDGIRRDGPDPGEITIQEHGLKFRVRPAHGHKTGWFCDQRDNRLRIGQLARGRDVLDLCCNAGGFALRAAAEGARSVLAVDLDEDVLARAEASARLNDLEVSFRHQDIFHTLRGMLRDGGRRPDLVVLDPHKLIPNRRELESGLERYSDMNTLALQVVAKGGLVASFSCSGALDLPGFLGMIFRAARRSDRTIRLLETLGAGPDHPQRPDFPRSRYLKGALLAVD